ncbi:MAG: DUF2914 domain-containing protein [Gammaproteobacteria bacterium]
MAEHKKALKIKITMQSPKTPAQSSEAQKSEPRVVLLAFVGVVLGLGAVLVWWGFTGARPDGAGKEVAPLDAQLTLERPVTSPSTASTTLDTEDLSVASSIDEPALERMQESESTQAEPTPETEPVQAASPPIPAIPVAEEVVANAELGSVALPEAEPDQVADNRADMPAPPQLPSEKLAATAPPPRSNEPATVSLTSDSARIARALFTNAIRGGEPTDAEGPVIFSQGGTGKSLYFFTELRGLQGERVTHRWEYQGKPVLSIPFKIGSNRWRVYSNKRLPANMTGNWRVVIADSSGAVIAAKEFRYQKR